MIKKIHIANLVAKNLSKSNKAAIKLRYMEIKKVMIKC